MRILLIIVGICDIIRKNGKSDNMKTAGRKELRPVRIKDGVYLISDCGFTSCYLVTGEKKAMLIDCGTGFFDFKGAVSKLTDLPLIVVATHAHTDHIGGMRQFPEIYVHKDDINIANRFMASTPGIKLFISRNAFLKKQGVTAKDLLKKEYNTKIIPFDEGAAFDLGGKIITVKHTPGHSTGSVALIDEKDKLIFSGDNVCDALWMQLPGGTSIEEWLPGAKWLYEMSAEYDVYWSHRTPRLTHEYIGQIVLWGEEILKKHKKNAFISKTAQYPKQRDGIIYRTGKVFKR